MNGAVDVEIPTLRWTQVSSASRYELNVGRDVDFSPGTYQVCTTANTTFPRLSRTDVQRRRTDGPGVIC